MTSLDKAVEFLAEQSALEWLLEDAAILLEYVSKQYLPKDRPLIREVERKFEDPIVGVLDVLLYNGIPTIIDWKVTKNIDEKFTMRQQRSLQFPLYAAIVKAEFGILPEVKVRALSLDDKDRVRASEIPITITEEICEDAIQSTGMISAFFEILPVDHPWPKVSSGCRAFGPKYPCRFEDICWWQRNNSAFALDKKPRLSYTSIEQFFRCPEMLRLLRCSGSDDEEPSEILTLGRLFHDSVAVMYKEERERI